MINIDETLQDLFSNFITTIFFPFKIPSFNVNLNDKIRLQTNAWLQYRITTSTGTIPKGVKKILYELCYQSYTLNKKKTRLSLRSNRLKKSSHT